MSIGAVCCSTANMKREDLIKRADNCLYLAKSSGRNRAVFDT
ncbi:MAG: diguanylate cyclase [Bacillota bacterium]